LFAVAEVLLGVTASWFAGLSECVALPVRSSSFFDLGTAGNLSHLILPIVPAIPSTSGSRNLYESNTMGEDSGWDSGLYGLPCWTSFRRNYSISGRRAPGRWCTFGLLVAYGRAALPMLAIAYGGRLQPALSNCVPTCYSERVGNDDSW